MLRDGIGEAMGKQQQGGVMVDTRVQGPVLCCMQTVQKRGGKDR